MTDTVKDTVEQALDHVQDLTTLQNPKSKKEFFDNLEKTTNHKRISLEATYSKIIQRKAKEHDLNPEDFKKKEKKKFSNTLGMETKIEKKDIADNPQQSKTNLQTQNPNAMQIKPQLTPEQQEVSLKALAGGVDSFFSAFIDDMDELTPTEKEDLGVCFDMAFGDYLRDHSKAKIVFAFVAFLGFYTNRIKKARRKKKARKAKEEKEKAKTAEHAQVIQQSTQEEFLDKSRKYLQG